MVLDIYEKCNADKGCLERWQRWQQHRDTINTILSEKIFSQAHIKDAVVLGAGRCEDIDLKFLLSYVDSLTLVDYDYHSMEKALERQQLTDEEKDKIILKGNIEFTGFYEEDFINEVTNKIKEKQDPESVLNFIMQQLSLSKSNIKGLLEDKEYALVISGAVHSQLIVPFMEIVSIDPVYANAFMPHIGYMAKTLGENYNISLLSLIKENGWLFSFYDMMELSERNNTLQYEEVINDLIARNEYEEIDEIITKKGGVAGSRHGYYHLDKLVKENMPSRKSWIWQFRDNKKYYVRSICFNKTQK